MQDASTYKWNGRDSDGLSLWLRLKGSNRCENYHQKLESAIGSWTVGPELGHYIMLLLTFRHNVNTDVQRYNGINFHHYELDLIDRIQIRVQQLCNTIVFKNHVNMSLFEGDSAFISVGVGPSHYSSDYVVTGPPDDRLKPDLRFIAEKMNLQCPPLPIAHKHEKKVFNDFYKTTPQCNDQTRTELAKLFLSKTNLVTIFPKLPSMIKSHETKWKKNSLIKLACTQMSAEFDKLLLEISDTTDDLPVNSTTNGNADIVHNIRADSAAALVDLHPPTNDIVQRDNDISSNLPKSPVLALNSKSRKQRRCTNHPICNSLAAD